MHKTSGTPAGEGAITLGYYDDDAARTITRGGTTTTIERDTAGRRLNLTTGASKEVKHYTDDSDNPSWTSRTEGTKETLTRYESTIGGDLALTITDDVVELAINNPHGDTVTTIPLTGDEAGTGIKGWAQYDEYGNQTTDPVSTGATSYGWHGADQRALDTSGRILMGARLYNPATGLFTSRDPGEGGNSTTYTHPQDPIGMQDISGQWGWFRDAWKNVTGFVREAWQNPWVRTAVNIGTLFIPGGALLKGEMVLYKGYRLYKGLRAGNDGLRATRGASRVAGRLWTGARAKRSSYSYGGTKSYRLHNKRNHNIYRGPTNKNNKKWKGVYSNSENHKRKINLHVKIVKKSWWRIW